MSSVVLAACLPDHYSVADSRALTTVMMLRAGRTVERVGYSDRSYWEDYQDTRGQLASALGRTRRELDRAFWAANGRLSPSQ